MLPIPAEELNGSGTLGPYWTFYRAVVAEQLSRWLPADPSVVLDLSGGRGRWSGQAARAGHRVIEVLDFRRAAERADAGCATPTWSATYAPTTCRSCPTRASTRWSPRSGRCRSS